MYNLKHFFRINFLQVFYQCFEFHTSLHFVLELTEMSVKLMDNVVCYKLPVLFLLFYLFIFYSVVFSFIKVSMAMWFCPLCGLM